MTRRALARALGAAVIVIAAGYIAFRVSPWPSALLVRVLFEQHARTISKALEKHVPAGVVAVLDEHYDPTDEDAYLDVYYPSEVENGVTSLPTIVWVHGGAWVSGSKEDIANYLEILASSGFTVVGVGYSLAPGSTYPTPVKQVNAALAYLEANAQRLHVKPSEIVLAGDSGGAQIAAQLANIISVPSYASAVGIVPSIERAQLSGVILYCGAYDIEMIDMKGAFAGFLKTVLWSYTGTKDFMSDPRVAEASVIHYVTSDFPRTFISGGNADPLTPQSRAFAEAIARLGVHVDSLFFPTDYEPALPHEYQFNLDTDAGMTALERSTRFLSFR